MSVLRFTLAEDSKADWHRNIVSLRKSVDIFADLIDEPGEAQILIEHEQSAKLTRRVPPIIVRPFDEAGIYNPILDVIRWEFDHPKRSRFSNGSYGVWYGARDVITSVYETAHHFRKYVNDSEAPSSDPIRQERRVHLVRCSAMLVDLRPHLAEHPQIIDRDDYSFSQTLGAQLRGDMQPGLITHSARHTGHDVIVVFTEEALSDPRNICYFTYTLDRESGHVSVERTPGQVELVID